MSMLRLLFFIFSVGLFQGGLWAEEDESVLIDHSPKGTVPSPMSSLTYYLFLLGLFAVMWFTVIRPQKKEQQKKEIFLKNLAHGQQVVTTGGLIGRVINVYDQYVILDLGQNTVKVLKNALTGPFNAVQNQTENTTHKTGTKSE